MMFGFLMDKKGHHLTLLIVSSVINTISYVLFSFLPGGRHAYAIIPLILFGISQGTYFVCLYTFVPLVVVPSAIGTGFGIASACEFAGISISPLLLSIFIRGNEFKYGAEGLFLVFIIFSSFGVLLSILLFIINFLHVKNQRPAIDRYRSYNERLKTYCQRVVENNKTDSE